jgi:hypothetical protein
MAYVPAAFPCLVRKNFKGWNAEPESVKEKRRNGHWIQKKAGRRHLAFLRELLSLAD